MQMLVRQPVEVHVLQPLALAGENEVEVPREQTDVEVRIPLTEPVQKLEQADFGAGRCIAPRSSGTPLSNSHPKTRIDRRAFRAAQ
jgi:hypothetical protein